MQTEHRYNLFRDFDFALLDNSEFREDSVREELVVPVLKALGYGPAGDYRIIRSRRLKHPFISVGSRRKKLEVVPDYLFEVKGKLAWVLDAKSPVVDLDNTSHLEQCYSYAIHPEIRVPYFALCNGRRFVLYHINKPRPILDFQIQTTSLYFGDLQRLLSPKTVLDYDNSFKKDFGLHLKRMGFDKFKSLVFPLTPIQSITRMADNLFSFSSGVKPSDEDIYVATFDFDQETFQQLDGKIPDSAMTILRKPVIDSMNTVQFIDAMYRVTVECTMNGQKLEENEDEIFLPLRVKKFIEHSTTA